MTDFTKGEWGIIKDGIKTYWVIAKTKPLPTIVSMIVRLKEEEEEANAHLISASPDMYEALELLLKYAMIHTVTGVIYPEGTHEEGIRNAINALKKARGEL